jgi:exodeoxyribonuclease-3
MTTITTLNLKQGGGSRTRQLIASLQHSICDIFVLLEFRQNENGTLIKTALHNLGYIHLYTTNANPQLNSVLIACKQPFQTQTFPELAEHSQRVVKISSSDFTLLATYFPGDESKKHVFDFLIKYIHNHPEEKVIVTGDINTGKHYIDEKGDRIFHSKHFHKLIQAGLIDAWKFLHGQKREFTWYSPSGDGYRLDHFFVHPTLKDNIKNCFYNHQPRFDKLTSHSMMTLELSK